ncbi:carbamoyltransferase N-terminal domain-containing protein [Aquimarina gracilis]|uniref:Carbamoyltransferase N-terminal domain-containing protein n=1 Tax=Aquimarina gracilis TaxID=874422 RepID=A0ABU5ZSP2_9FLAO|nr:carbamoyltransferase N-terminal domain-containing protein [Aquimarina gracilis]MEB3344963.1 carbamoyltransferase N-terminal domain-containing protein [Aquimarina gracilis]
MIICGLKLTHDGAIALIDNDKLIFSYEMEKLNNNPRFSSLLDLDLRFLASVLNEHGYKIENVDKFVIDGWGEYNEETAGKENDAASFFTKIKDMLGREFEIEFGKYGMLVKDEDVLEQQSFSYLSNDFDYNSYLHISGHLMGAYCTSPFAKNKEDSFVLVWDGGMFPQCFYFNATTRKIDNLGPIFHIKGDSYASFASNYNPFTNFEGEGLSIAGKVMAYIALGKCIPEVLSFFKDTFNKNEGEILTDKITDLKTLINRSTNLLKEFVIYGEINDVKPVDLMATYHVFLQEILLVKLKGLVDRYPMQKKNLCMVGGCALNIKWNSAIRNSGMFEDVWVPPFPNDSGSAVGAACCEMLKHTEELALDWNVYSGPFLNEFQDNDLWTSVDCAIPELARIIHEFNEPIIFLNGRAELGPRALGNRSILSAPVSTTMKGVLNKIKGREDYRPVAPICIVEDAPQIFSPGTPDPYMLYDHKVRDQWIDKIPAITHLDGTARLQTVSEQDNPEVYGLLQEYKKLSGVPLLCNTSANHSGKGFFPDVQSVMDWGKVNAIWSEGKIYVKKGEKIHLESELFKMLEKPY